VKSDGVRPIASPDPLPHVGRASVSDAVADHIRRLVFFGELADGQRVPQREIAETLGVSSVPVREALAGLQQEGVVTIVPNRGAFVIGLNADVVREQFYVFGRIYGLATRVVARRGDPAVLATLRSLADQIRVEKDLDKLLAASIRFQLTIVGHGGSMRLRALFTPMSRIVPGNFYVTIPGSDEATKRGVKAMIGEIEAGRAAVAERACWTLVDEIGELVAARFEGG
jgi:DNA-binding GntR family transcriptional regulator